MPNTATEKMTDMLVYSLMKEANLRPEPEKTKVREVQNALNTASKRFSGKVGFPEYIAFSGDFVLIVEDKKSNDKQAMYVSDKDDALLMNPQSVTDYAENGALHYAQHITANTGFKKVFAFGCSGTDKDSLIIHPIFVSDKSYKILPKVKTFRDFSESNIRSYYKTKVLGGKTERAMELENILNRAKQLDEDLRNYGGSLTNEERPIVVSGILLALCKHGFSTDLLTCGEGDTEDERKSDGEKIFKAIEQHVRYEAGAMPEDKVKILLNQFELIRLRPNLSNKHDHLQKSPLKYFAEYIHSKVLSAIQNNTPEDVLGRFYGEFLSYSAGDGKSLGIVLTPAHITRLMCELVGVRPDDNIFDPTCGTGAFLIASMSSMVCQVENEDLTKAKKEDKITQIKHNQLHGIELNEKMFAIATTNMILRGDGKSNLMNKDFFTVSKEEMQKAGYTVGLMNPPYSQAKNKTTSHLSELRFISHLLDGMKKDGRVAVIVPQSTMVGKNKDDKKIKESILEKHTLEGVITCNTQTFYPVATNPVIAVFTAHEPHPEKKRCKFIDFKDDGFVLYPHLGMLDNGTHDDKVKYLLDCWRDYVDENEIPTSFMVRSTVTADDEWLHSFFYFNDDIPSEEEFRKAMADYLSFEFNMIVSGRGYLFGIDEKEEIEDKSQNVELAAEPLQIAAKAAPNFKTNKKEK